MKYKKSFKFEINKKDFMDVLSEYLKEYPDSNKDLLELTRDEIDENLKISKDYTINLGKNEIATGSGIYEKVDAIELEEDIIIGLENVSVDNDVKQGTSMMYFYNGYICSRKYLNGEVVEGSLEIIRRNYYYKYKKKLPMENSLKTFLLIIFLIVMFLIAKCSG